MTDREAIDVLFNEWKCIDRNDGIHCDRKCESCDLVMDVWIIREAFNMAISALEAQEAKAQLSAEGTTSDLISRQEAIDAADRADYTGLAVEDVKKVTDEVVKEIKKLPSAQPERPKGKWIDAIIPNDNGGLPVQVCDQCNTFFPLAYTGGGHHFCPQCGADMKEEDA